MHNKSSKRRGFTLAELMVVIVIIGLLVTVVGPNVLKYLTKGKWVRVKADIHTLDGAVTNYAIFNAGNFPDTMQLLVEKDANGNAFLNRDTLPKDPWGNEYLYEPPGGGNKFRIYTYGADGAVGGEGDDADYDNHMLRNE